MAKLKLQRFQPTELQEQFAIFDWARLQSHRYPALKLLHASLNGVRLSIGLAVKCKRAGMVSGCPDICLPVPMDDPAAGGHWCGLYLELKRRKGGRISDEQNLFMEKLQELGYYVRVCNGAHDAIDCIAAYLGIPI